MVLAGFLGYFLADYSIVKANILSSPVALTIGITLNIPISMVIDSFVYSLPPGWMKIVGSLVCVCGFVLVSVVESSIGERVFNRKNSTKFTQMSQDF